jgi:hypothetical protein
MRATSGLNALRGSQQTLGMLEGTIQSNPIAIGQTGSLQTLDEPVSATIVRGMAGTARVLHSRLLRRRLSALAVFLSSNFRVSSLYCSPISLTSAS